MSEKSGSISGPGTIRTFLKKGMWAEALINVLDRGFGHPMELEEHAAAPLSGGILSYGFQCGMLWGSSLAAGAQAYHLLGPGPRAEELAVRASQQLVPAFGTHTGSKSDCLAITGLNLKGKLSLPQILRFLITFRVVRCFTMSGGYAKNAFRVINSVPVSEKDGTREPVSCASLVAKKAGASDLHVTMAAGLAGGIGLSGGGCGALGAAVWIAAMNIKDSKATAMMYDPDLIAIFEDFSRRTNDKITCRDICGRGFNNIDEHAAYLSDGGCSALVNSLAAVLSAQQINNHRELPDNE